jgi:hypothetical protein
MRIFLALTMWLTILVLSGCDPDESEFKKQFDHEAVLVKTCGVDKVYRFKDQLWFKDDLVWREVAAGVDQVCDVLDNDTHDGDRQTRRDGYEPGLWDQWFTWRMRLVGSPHDFKATAQEDNTTAQQDNDVHEADEEALCLAVDPISGASNRNYQLVYQKDYVWTAKDALPESTKNEIVIGVSFLDGTDDQKKEVETYAWEWVKRAGLPIRWLFGDESRQNIRIRFNGKKDSVNNWSLYGNRASLRSHPSEPNKPNEPDEATMLLNVYHRESAKKIRRQKTLHEFGHALGLMHEQLHPDSGLKFNEVAIVEEMKKNKWCNPNENCLEKVQKQITHPAPRDHACRGAPKYDEHSIMHYPIPANWTTDGKTISWNLDLSKGDLDCVRSLYVAEPRPPQPPPPIGGTECDPLPTCCTSRCRRCGSVRLSRIVSWPPLPPRWMREFWDEEWWDDE